MELRIMNRKFDKIISDRNLMLKKLGMDMTKVLIRRINNIKSFSNFYDFLESGLGSPHRLSGDLNGMYAVSLTKNYRLLIKPLSDFLDKESLINCKIVIVKGVIDYHGEKYEWIIN